MGKGLFDSVLDDWPGGTGKEERPHPRSVLDEARGIINEMRGKQCGGAEDKFQLIAAFWTVATGHVFTARDVALCMSLFKMAHILTGTGTRDSYVDLCGYAALAADMAEDDGGKKA